MNAASPFNDGIGQEKAMDHGEALQMMAAERYLLDELAPEERDSFELHMFDCQECALDLRAGAAFIREAKTQLIEMEPRVLPSIPDKPAPAKTEPKKKKRWSFLWQPAFAMPAFAVLLAVIAYQNFSAIPSLRRAAAEPKVLYSNPIHLGTRGSAHTAVQADRTDGLSLSIELPQSSSYSSFVFELEDPSGKKVWTQTIGRSNKEAEDDSIVSLVIPGAGLHQASYTLSIWATTPQNNRVDIDRRTLDVQFGN
jgi:hypothetical protein